MPAPTLSRTEVNPSTTQPTISPQESTTPLQNESGFLTTAQKARITFAAFAYLASDEEQTGRIVNILQKGDSSGVITSIGGPLAIAILRDAGVIDAGTDVSAFWAIDAESLSRTFEKTLMENQFTRHHFESSLGDYDFSIFLLQVTDVVVLNSSVEGMSNQIAVVTRVDEQNRVYSINNIETDAGMTIQEVMLYDPLLPGKGSLNDWTAGQSQTTGSPGTGGVDVWRVSSPVLEQGLDEQGFADQLFTDQIDRTITAYGGTWHILIREGEGRTIYSRLSDVQSHVGSVIKIPIAMLFFKYLEGQGISPAEYETYLSSNGRGGRTYADLLYSMLVLSEEAATDLMGQLLDKTGSVYPVLNSWGVMDTLVFKRYSTTEDIDILFEGLYKGDFITPEGRNIILKLMETYTPEDDTRLGLIRTLLPEGAHFYDKRSTLIDERLVVGDAAIVSYPILNKERVYFIVITGYPGEKETTSTTLELAIEKMARLFWNYADHCETFAKSIKQ